MEDTNAIKPENEQHNRQHTQESVIPASIEEEYVGERETSENVVVAIPEKTDTATSTTEDWELIRKRRRVNKPELVLPSFHLQPCKRITFNSPYADKFDYLVLKNRSDLKLACDIQLMSKSWSISGGDGPRFVEPNSTIQIKVTCAFDKKPLGSNFISVRVMNKPKKGIRNSVSDTEGHSTYIRVNLECNE